MRQFEINRLEAYRTATLHLAKERVESVRVTNGPRDDVRGPSGDPPTPQRIAAVRKSSELCHGQTHAVQQRLGLRIPLHSMTSLAMARSDGGTLRPSAFAALRLMTSSYPVGAWTGSSAGFVPFRMRST